MSSGGGATNAVDSIHERLTDYAYNLTYEDLSPEAIHTAKIRVIDTIGALFGGYKAEPCRIARALAAKMQNAEGATVIGTRMKANADMAAFVNAATSRCVEMNDVYQYPGSYFCHPSDALLPVLAAAEYAHASGRELITGIVLAYEIFLRICDQFHDFANGGFDGTTFGCLGVAAASAKLMRLSRKQIAHSMAMAIVPNNALKVSRMGQQLSMWKVAAAGQGGRGGVFAALLAEAGMEGPNMPFEGRSGWCDHVALKRFTLDEMGGPGTRFKILDSSLKLRPCIGLGITSVLATEQIAPLSNIRDIKKITVEAYRHAKEFGATGEHRWNPRSKESADHSIPYIVAATLVDGKLTLGSYDEAHLWNEDLRALMGKVEVIENEAFTKAHQSVPVVHCARVTVVRENGEQIVGEIGGGKDGLTTPKSDLQIEEKFNAFAQDYLGKERCQAILKSLWSLDEVKDVAVIPPELAIN